MNPLGNCKTCAVLATEVEYLQKIIDRLLIKNGVTQIDKEPEPEEPEPEVKGEVYGD